MRKNEKEEEKEKATMTTEVPAATLHTGAKMPLLGLGTWKSKPGQVGSRWRDGMETEGGERKGCVCVCAFCFVFVMVCVCVCVHLFVSLAHFPLTHKTQVEEAVRVALETGYRHIDCAGM